MDHIDKKILHLLQSDSTLSITELSDQVGISSTPCWRRIQKLEKEGIIARRVAILDRNSINLAITVFVMIKTGNHSIEWLQEFSNHIENIDEVAEFYRMSGTVDYLIKIIVPDIEAYDVVYKRIIQIDGIQDVSSSFAMEELKYSTALPLHYIK